MNNRNVVQYDNNQQVIDLLEGLSMDQDLATISTRTSRIVFLAKRLNRSYFDNCFYFICKILGDLSCRIVMATKANNNGVQLRILSNSKAKKSMINQSTRNVHLLKKCVDMFLKRAWPITCKYHNW